MSRTAILISALFLYTPLAAQQPTQPSMMMPEAVPVIATTAEGEAHVVPDRATISIGVQTRAATAAQASAENASKQRAVIDTLRALGIPAAQISTVNYNVYPEQTYHPDQGDKAPKIVGYNVVNTVQVEVHDIGRLGTLIDAALAKGANGINSLELSASNTDEARRSALAAALTRARGDAEALARQAGGSLGSLIEATTGSPVMPRPVMGMMERARAGATPTPIAAGEQTIHVTVSARWHFVSGSR